MAYSIKNMAYGKNEMEHTLIVKKTEHCKKNLYLSVDLFSLGRLIGDTNKMHL